MHESDFRLRAFGQRGHCRCFCIAIEKLLCIHNNNFRLRTFRQLRLKTFVKAFLYHADESDFRKQFLLLSVHHFAITHVSSTFSGSVSTENAFYLVDSC